MQINRNLNDVWRDLHHFVLTQKFDPLAHLRRGHPELFEGDIAELRHHLG
jgi:hypothetical protein